METPCGHPLTVLGFCPLCAEEWLENKTIQPRHLNLTQADINSITNGGKQMPYYDENGNPVVVTAGEESTTGSTAIWAITAIIVVALIAGVAYFGFKQLNRNTRHDIDIKVETPVNR